MKKGLQILFYVLFVGGLGYGLIGGIIAEKKFEKQKQEEALQPLQTAPGAYITPEAYNAEPGDTITLDPAPTGGLLNWARWLWGNYEEIAGILLLLIMAIDPITRWTPTEKDNNLLRSIQSWIDRLIPNAKKAGGVFTAFKTKEDAPALAAAPPLKE